MSENIHRLEKEIHSSHSISLFSNDHFANRIGTLTSQYSLTEDFHAYANVIQELNRKYSQFNLSNKIVSPVDAGLKPTSLTNFIASLGSSSPDPSPDSVLTEAGDTLVQENGFNLLLEQSS